MSTEHLDVLIVGAGISGIGAGCHLQKRCPGRTYAILEGREDLGGTWDLFRYPGIRSDSDMYTLGYSFKPWTKPKAIADGPSILEYLRETATSNGVDKRIRFGHRVKRASWSSHDACWTVEAERGPNREPVRFTCNFLFMCSGYYNYAEGYTPQFPGAERFAGRIVHPQKWTEDIDHANKRVVVIGSGATAVTIVPEMAKTAAHVTMLQRSPTYVISMPAEDFIAKGIALRSGKQLEADIIVTATGLNLQLLGGVQVSVDGREVALAQTLNYKGMMFSDVPNLASSFGYTNASWTLKCDLTCEYVCRLLNHMQKHGYRQCTPRNVDPSVIEEPWIDFSSGYVQRSLHTLPKQGSKLPWKLYQNYAFDIMMLRYGSVEDGVMEFQGAKATSTPLTATS
jgi:cation diffusion facilitator CzcD-associated flavoprotein CzcO